MSEEKTTSKLSGEDMSVVSGGGVAIDPILYRESDPMQFINPFRTEDDKFDFRKDRDANTKTGDP